MPGNSFNIRIDGRVYALPEDLEPTVTIGGKYVKATLRNGDGTAVPQMASVQGAIRGISVRCRIADGDMEALKASAAKSRIDVDYFGPEGHYTGSGFIESGDEGLKMNQGTGVTEAFSFICDRAPLTFRA